MQEAPADVLARAEGEGRADVALVVGGAQEEGHGVELHFFLVAEGSQDGVLAVGRGPGGGVEALGQGAGAEGGRRSGARGAEVVGGLGVEVVVGQGGLARVGGDLVAAHGAADHQGAGEEVAGDFGGGVGDLVMPPMVVPR